jgi:hypothetical protein
MSKFGTHTLIPGHRTRRGCAPTNLNPFSLSLKYEIVYEKKGSDYLTTQGTLLLCVLCSYISHAFLESLLNKVQVPVVEDPMAPTCCELLYLLSLLVVSGRGSLDLHGSCLRVVLLCCALK